MKDTEFGAAKWGLDWNQVKSDRAILGKANLSESGVVLDVPFGWIFWTGGVVIPESDQQLPEESDYLYGFTQTGDWIVLKDCFPLSGSSSIPGGKCQKISANYLLSSREQFEPNRNIELIEIGFIGFAEWFGEIPLRQTFNSDTMWFSSLEFDAEKSKKINEVLFEDDLYKLVIDHAYRTSPVKVDGFTFSHESYLRVELKVGRSFEDVQKFVAFLQNFFVLSMGFFCEIDFLRLKFEGAENKVNCYGNYYKGKEPTNRQLREMPFPRRRIRGAERVIFANYLYARDDFLEALNLLSNLVGRNWNLPSRLEILASSQCLEAISRIDVDMNSIDPREYDRIVQIIKESITDEKALKWISDRMPGNRKGQKRLLIDLSHRHSRAFEWTVCDIQKYIDLQTKLRNNSAHAHNTEDDCDFEDQYWHVKATELISFIIIWEMLGLSNDTVIEALNQSRYMSYVLEHC